MTPLQQRDIHLFDLDNTLYHPKYKIIEQIVHRMAQYVAKDLNMSYEEADSLCFKYFSLYGGSMRGLQLHNQTVDLQAFSDYSHDVDLSHVQPALDLQKAFSRCTKKRFVFTNSPKTYALKMLKHLGIDSYFDGIFSVEQTDYKMKPDPHAFEQICRYFDFPAANAVMYDDQPLNLATAKQLGMRTVLVNRDDLSNTDACYQTEQLAGFIDRVTG